MVNIGSVMQVTRWRTHWGIPVCSTALVIRVGAIGSDKVTPLRDVLLALLPTNLDLLFFTATTELILLELRVLVVCPGIRRVKGTSNTTHSRDG